MQRGHFRSSVERGHVCTTRGMEVRGPAHAFVLRYWYWRRFVPDPAALCEEVLGSPDQLVAAYARSVPEIP
eukprot:107527-Rhodomonas_salina.2